MVFWPGLIFALIEYTYVREKVNNFLIAKIASLFVMPSVIALGWYAYTPFTQKSVFRLDLILFYVAVLLGQLVSYKLLTSASLSKQYKNISTFVILALLLAFSLFTFYPPEIFLFEHFDLMDTGEYGILENYEGLRYFTQQPNP